MRRILAAAVCAVFTAASWLPRALPQEADPPKPAARMSPEEAAALAARAATAPELEDFAGGYLEGLLYAAVLGAILALAWTVGVLFGFPVGFDHSLKGKPFIPKEVWSAPPGIQKTVVILAVVAGFPLYGLGYCAGLPLRTSPPPADAEPDPGRVLGVALLDLHPGLDIEGGLRLTSVEPRAFGAGARTGDLLLRIGETPVTGANLRSVLRDYAASPQADLTLLRDGTRLTARVPLVWPKKE